MSKVTKYWVVTIQEGVTPTPSDTTDLLMIRFRGRWILEMSKWLEWTVFMHSLYPMENPLENNWGIHICNTSNSWNKFWWYTVTFCPPTPTPLPLILRADFPAVHIACIHLLDISASKRSGYKLFLKSNFKTSSVLWEKGIGYNSLYAWWAGKKEENM